MTRRFFTVCALLLLAYLGLQMLFALLSEHHGLVSPSGSLSLTVAAVGVAVLGLRLVVVFVLPGLLVYRVVAALLTKPRRRKERSS